MVLLSHSLFELFDALAKGGDFIFRFAERAGSQFGTLPSTRYSGVLATLVVYAFSNALVAGEVGIALELFLAAT